MSFLDKLMEKQKEHNEKYAEKTKSRIDKIEQIREKGNYKLNNIKDKKEENKLGAYYLNSSKKEIQELQVVLNESEVCKYLVDGFACGDTWIIAITNSRLIFLHKKLKGDIKKKYINISDIKFTKLKTGLLSGKIEIGLNDEYIVITNIYKDYVEGMFNLLNETIIKCIMNRDNIEYGEAKLVWDDVSKEYELAKIEKENKLKEEKKEKERQEYEKAKREYEEKIKAKEEEKRNEKQYQKDRLKQLKRDHIPYCPKCHSTAITYQGKKISIGKAIVGGVLLGPGGTVLGGLSGKKGKVVCLNCGHKWKL
ncbi:septum formation inhibitor MinC [Clostridium moniliforme]|uniref:Septum formation inhibitor MinC n=1 Tax=Clostridium moniliforme TaxID=39489 RepID=A0ABS4F0V4_9CLOT|nr:PH domain-containing protein [Clostridium moniliforme]MBP1889884.1 septum formation inhibitor MinC [Clostridium moniliforme]